MKKTLAILLLLTLVVGCGKNEQAQKQPSGDAVDALKALGCYIKKNEQGEVVHISFVRCQHVNDGAWLPHLKGLTGLQELSFNLTEISDAGLVHLKGLTNLQGLGRAHGLTPVTATWLVRSSA